MKINFKVRLKNPLFWLTAIPAVTSTIYTILALFGIVPSISEDTLLNAVSAIITALTALGVLVDPTTPGIRDSDRAMTYIVPGEDGKLFGDIEIDEDVTVEDLEKENTDEV